MEVKCILSEKGKQLLVINNFKFCVAEKLKSGQCRWRCVNKKSKCSAKVYTSDNDFTIITKHDLQHNHVEAENIQRQALNNSVKRKAVDNLVERPSKIICEELRRSTFASEIVSEDLERIRKNMWYARRCVLPPLPKTQADVFDKLSAAMPKTNKDEDFLLINNKHERIIVFSCISNLKFLCSLETVYMDGTFQFCTKFFQQFFTIHGYKNGHYVPLVFCLLPNKSKDVYLKLLQLLEKKCIDVDIFWKPKEVVIDFEVAIHNAVAEMWPESNVIGCRFHLCQAWYRKIQSLGLVNDYNRETNIGKHLKHFFGLQFLNPHEVGDCFAELFDCGDGNSKVVEFQDYLVDNYIGETALFPPHIWACLSSSMARTTNNCESFHSKFNQNFYSSHPNLYDFLEILKNFQAEVYVKVYTANKFVKKLRPEIIRRQKYLNHMIFRKNSGEISALDFVKCICYRYAPK